MQVPGPPLFITCGRIPTAVPPLEHHGDLGKLILIDRRQNDVTAVANVRRGAQRFNPLAQPCLLANGDGCLPLLVQLGLPRCRIGIRSSEDLQHIHVRRR